MFFDDWKKYKNDNISKTLFWDYDMDKFDWDDMKIEVVKRVIERGWEKDYYAIFKKYGGIGQVKEIIKQIPILSDKDMNFVCIAFNLKKKDLKCYTRKQLRKKLFQY